MSDGPASPPPAEGAPHSAPAHPNQFALLGQRRFAPFFWTQFLGAGNDNLFKFAFTVMVTYQLQVAWLPPAMAGLVIGALFILPFLLFSATSGQLADKWEKSRLMRLVKTMEIAIMALAAWGFWVVSVPVLLACVALMGLHSTLFGPVKFAYLPQHLDERELTGGNGMVEMGTFVAILLGNLAGGLLVAVPGIGREAVALACVGVALLGRLTAQFVPHSAATDPALAINWNPFTETWRNLRLAHQSPVVFRSLLGISWMWFFGAVFLSQFPPFAKEVLGGDEQVASLLLLVFSVGIAAGSLMCEGLSRRHVEIGLVPFGAIGMSVFSVDLWLATSALAAPGSTADAASSAALSGVGDFLRDARHWRVLADLALLAFFAGLYSVPMYALIQLRSQPTHRARIIAANNIINALFMIVSALLAGALLAAGLTIPQIFLVTGVLNALVAGALFLLVPEYLLRFASLIFTRLLYRFRMAGASHIPAQGAALLVCNHVSVVDAMLLMAASPRPIRFVMDHRIFDAPLLGRLFRLAQAIPIAPRAEDAGAHDRAFAEARRVLDEGGLLCIFPEGGITRDGTLQAFKAGLMNILETHPVPVVPLALHGLWGSFFSRKGGAAMTRPFCRGVWHRVGLRVAPPLPAVAVTPELLRERVAALLAAGRERLGRPTPFLTPPAPRPSPPMMAPPLARRWLAALGPRPAGWEVVLSVAVGVGLAWLWIRLDEPWMRRGVPRPSLEVIGPGGEVLWALIALRWLAGALLLPVLEELFWRGFVMRRIGSFTRQPASLRPVDPREVGLGAVLISTAGFALTHTAWLATALTGLACAALYRRTGKLGCAIVAHAVCQGLVGAWIVVYGHWGYW